MKRIIREVVTMIRIERWLVREESSDRTELATSASGATATVCTEEAEQQAEETSVVIEETVVDPPHSPNERVISQRVLEVRQWEVKHDGES